MNARPLHYGLGVVGVAAWGVAVIAALAVGKSVSRIDGSLSRANEVAEQAEALQESAAKLDRSLQLLEPGPREIIIIERDASTPDGQAKRTRESYEVELASALMKCDPEAMLRYEETVPFFIFGNPTLRSGVAAVMHRKGFDGARWRRAAAGDGAAPRLPSGDDFAAREWRDTRQLYELARGPQYNADFRSLADASNVDAAWASEESADRLVRMAAACVNIFFDGSLLTIDHLPE